MNVARVAIAAVLLLAGSATGAIAQERGLVPRGGSGFTINIEGTKQGQFAGGGKSGGIGGLQFSYLLKSPRDAASGLASGKRQHGPVVFTKVVGPASTQLFQALTTNEMLKSVVINLPGSMAGAGDESRGYMVTLTNASVSEIKQYTEALNGRPTVLEDVSFTFQKIEVQDPATRSMAVDDWQAGVN
jgi:type VI secretion system secreted protein Hcp